MKKSKKERHILALSGGKDSAALAVYLTRENPIPNLEFVFCDTGHELPETYEYFQKIEAVLDIKITVLKPKRDFDFWLKIFKGCLPSPKNRWCTRQLKIVPYEEYIGNDIAYSYIGLRADEDREGYISSRGNIMPRYPFIKEGIEYADVEYLLKSSGLDFPKYYAWRSRSGCYFCFFQRRHEWIGLYDNHPTLFKHAIAYESNHLDDRVYTWIQGESLEELLKRRNAILSDAKDTLPKSNLKNGKLSNELQNLNFSFGDQSIFNDVFNEDESCAKSKRETPCLICTL